MILEHKQAVLARLRADTALANKTYDTEVKSTNGVAVSTIHSVGSTAEQAQAVAAKVYKQLMGFKPTVADRSCWPMRAEMSQAVRPDKFVLPVVFYAVDEFTLSSTPA